MSTRLDGSRTAANVHRTYARLTANLDCQSDGSCRTTSIGTHNRLVVGSIPPRPTKFRVHHAKGLAKGRASAVRDVGRSVSRVCRRTQWPHAANPILPKSPSTDNPFR